MADQPRKESLTSELDAARAKIGGYVTVLRHDLDVRERFKANFNRHQVSWLSAAVGLGLLLSRIPRSGVKPVVPEPINWSGQAKKIGKGAWMLAVLKFALSLARPSILGVLSRKLIPTSAFRR